MFRELLQLRGQVYDASGKFYSAQIAYAKTVNTGRSLSEVRAAAKTALEAVKPYEAALEALLYHLLTIEVAQHREQEVMRTLRLLALLCSEEKAWSQLVTHSSSWKRLHLEE